MSSITMNYSIPFVLTLSLMPILSLADAAVSVSGQGDIQPMVLDASSSGKATEKQLPLDESSDVMKKDVSGYKEVLGERVETSKKLEKQVKTVKLQNVVPPIHFDSGQVKIPDDYIAKVKGILDSMVGRKNVRLHLVGYTDNLQLSGALKDKYIDNAGLSRERAGEAAEFFQKALNLPSESISYEGMGDSHPLASNSTEAGRKLNRRMEVEVWYDEVEENVVEKQNVVVDRVNRVNVCRVEQMCKIRYKEGFSKRARLRNVVPPLHFDDTASSIPPEYMQKLMQVLNNLESKRNVTLKFIGYTDNVPLVGRDARIYGNALSLSKARARRVALAVQDALKLPENAVISDGRGDTNPLAPNDTATGRSANNRIEVEFGYDDEMQQTSDEPQLCPESAGAEVITKVYDPPSGPIKPIQYENSKPLIPEGYVERLRTLLGEVKDKTHVRLRFIGYINNERMDRRAALAYGDDIGLSTARAHTVMETIRTALNLGQAQVEHEGRGYVQSGDVASTGFLDSDESRVEVQIVYDELASLDKQEGMDITRITREVNIANPYTLNLMRITVDGQPIDDPNKSTADVQRCVDVALDKANVQFKFDNLNMKPRLNVTAWPSTIRYQDDPDTDYLEDQVHFKAYSNFPYFIMREEIRIFDAVQSLRDKPLATIVMDGDGTAQWQANFSDFSAKGRDLKYVLRVYDRAGNYDETEAQPLWVVDRVPDEYKEKDWRQEGMAGYGENRLAVENINLSGGTIRVYGDQIPPEHAVSVAGREVPVNGKGEFATEEILPAGLHSVEVAVLDKSGNGQLFLRDLDFERNDWFYVGIADLTASYNIVNGPAQIVTNDTSGHYDNNLTLDGRLAFYTNGKFGDNWQLIASADTLEGPVGSLFSNFMQKSPDAVFRRIEPDYYYPTYGDDSTTEESAPTLGKFYVKLKKDEHYGMWGNFKIGYTDNSLAHVDRTLYGANLHIQPGAVTSFGEKRFVMDGFAAQPGTVAGRDELRGTGGSLYYLRHQDIMTGSDKVRIEYRDKASGMVVSVKNLTPVLDYTIDYLQGRILLNNPLSPVAADNLLVASDLSSGNEAFLVVRYEYSTGFDDTTNLTTGGRAHYWLNDYLKVGVTGDKSNESANESSVKAYDVTLRKSAETWMKFETSTSTGASTTAYGSNDGGYSFSSATSQTVVAPSGGEYAASRVDMSLALKDVYSEANGRITYYHQLLGAGYSAPGLTANSNIEQFGANLQTNLSDSIGIRVKADKRAQDMGLETTATEVNVDYHLDENWTLSSGARNDQRIDRSPVVPVTQVQGTRTDAQLRTTYDSKERWLAYVYAQNTIEQSGNMDRNGRGGAGGSLQVNEKLRMNGEYSNGEVGAAAKLGTEYLYTDKTTIYANYTYENERTDNGVKASKGNMISGVKSHYSDTTSVYAEEKYSHGDVPTGLTHSTGVDYSPNDSWNLGMHMDKGSLRDNLTGARINRSGLGGTLGYGFETVKFSSAVEYRVDENQSTTDGSYSTRITWLTKNSLKYQFNPDWRFISKFNYSMSTSSQGDLYNGTYTEAVFGYGYRPVLNDKLNLLVKYTYFYNVPAAGQVTIANTAAAFIQKSHIFSVDGIYDLTQKWSVGGKYAHKLGQVSQDVVNPVFFDSRADLYIARLDWHFVNKWDFMTEARMLSLPDAQDRKSGFLTAIYRHLDKNFKLGAGYNFTDFSDDLTNLSYTYHGAFINLIGKI